MQAALRACDAHIHQPPLFLDFLVGQVVVFTAVWEDALLNAHQKHVRILQPLARVQRGEAHRIRVLFPAFKHADQRDGLREFEQVLAFVHQTIGIVETGGLFVTLFLGLGALALEPVHKLQHVGPLVLGLALVVGVVQVGLVVDAFHHLVEQRAGGFLRGAV